ncbi:hypothetical protein KFK09_002969 [Dendrobium nobile]|uniref:Secreted protein n=1 Tax=Dendrobium nobile TaxID=94219 RepID=A0A8T3C5E5_DENNO|nr:hypothetical protein KFK09_002969 [Dendrobium nobile]
MYLIFFFLFFAAAAECQFPSMELWNDSRNRSKDLSLLPSAESHLPSMEFWNDSRNRRKDLSHLPSEFLRWNLNIFFALSFKLDEIKIKLTDFLIIWLHTRLICLGFPSSYC